MNILVVGSLKDVPKRPKRCKEFVRELAAAIVDRRHGLLTGARGSLDKAIAKAAVQRLESQDGDARERLVSYRLKDAKPVHRHGTIRVSELENWELNHPELVPPEQFSKADIVIAVAGSQGTFVAANWARIAGKLVLGVAPFGGAGRSIYERERRQFDRHFARFVSSDEFDLLNQDTGDMAALAQDVVALAEHLVRPRTVFTVMRFGELDRDLFAAYRAVCEEFGFEAVATNRTESLDRIIPRIHEGIRRSAFVIADMTDMSPNVFYEVGFARGLGCPVILTAREGTKPPFDVVDIPVIFWRDFEDLREGLRARVGSVAKAFGAGEAAPPLKSEDAR